MTPVNEKGMEQNLDLWWHRQVFVSIRACQLHLGLIWYTYHTCFDNECIVNNSDVIAYACLFKVGVNMDQGIKTELDMAR